MRIVEINVRMLIYNRELYIPPPQDLVEAFDDLLHRTYPNVTLLGRALRRTA